MTSETEDFGIGKDKTMELVWKRVCFMACFFFFYIQFLIVSLSHVHKPSRILYTSIVVS